jgi:hypothetical protein
MTNDRQPQVDHTYFIFDRFVSAIRRHVVSNGLSERAEFEAPLMLLISGPPGVGKTRQVLLACKRLGYQCFKRNAASFVGAYEGAVLRPLIDVYVQASKYKRLNRVSVCILIDDFDLSIVNVQAGASYTEHSQLLVSQFMSICDEPMQMDVVDQDTGNVDRRNVERIPIIMTGNDFSQMHGPLVRHGRASVFPYVPTRDEWTNIISEIFRDFHHVRADYLERSFSEEPISFFSSLKVEVVHRCIDLVSQEGVDQHRDHMLIILEQAYSMSHKEILSIGKTISDRRVAGLKRYGS